MAYIIDTHAHIYLPEFAADLEDVLDRAGTAGVELVLMPAIDSATHHLVMETEARYPQCRAMMGLHPCSVNEGVAAELEVVERWLSQRPFVAVGEIGLDFYWNTTFKVGQYHAFRHQIGLALQYNLPVVIHSRSATPECISVVEEFPGVRGVFHCFSGTYEEAVRVMDAGMYLGIGGVATFKNGGLDKVLEKTGIDRVILETDAPYLAPVPYRGKRNEPAYAELVAARVAALVGLDKERVMEVTTQNAQNLFKL